VMRSLLLAVLAAASLLLLAAPADGKTGVRARLSSGVPLDAAPGERVTLRWTLGYRDERGRWRPGFDACGVFVRLLSASGASPTVGFDSNGACRPHRGGRYAAGVEVPAGGVGEVQIGLRGTTDVFFPLESDSPAAPPRRSAPTPKRTSAGPDASALVPGLTLASLAAVALAVAVLRRHRADTAR
jgi:hypothetical protein